LRPVTYDEYETGGLQPMANGIAMTNGKFTSIRRRRLGVSNLHNSGHSARARRHHEKMTFR
jgi:hypothetical protein